MAEVATLKEEGTWRQGDFVEDRGWVMLAGDFCAERLVAMEPPPTKKAITVNDGATPVQ